MSWLLNSLVQAGTLYAALSGAASVVAWVWNQSSLPSGPDDVLGGYVRITTSITLGVIAAACYGALWSAAEQMFKWRYGASGAPKGWHAVVLSLCSSLPLAFLPPIFEHLTSMKIVSSEHLRASVAMIIGAAVGHILLLGTERPRFKGLRDRVLPVEGSKDFGERVVQSTEMALAEHGSKIAEGDLSMIEDAMSDLRGALKGDDAPAVAAKTNALARASMKVGEMTSIGVITQRAVSIEAIYANVQFWSIVFVYQISAHIFQLDLWQVVFAIVTTISSSLIFFFGVLAFLIVRYPESVTNPQWVAIRGVVNGTILMVALSVGILR